eukprot:m.699951 g.699951  ORF g.699951 m.699951 type:complete len:177 (+) comp22908_c0_seq12:1415-1945(+)
MSAATAAVSDLNRAKEEIEVAHAEAQRAKDEVDRAHAETQRAKEEIEVAHAEAQRAHSETMQAKAEVQHAHDATKQELAMLRTQLQQEEIARQVSNARAEELQSLRIVDLRRIAELQHAVETVHAADNVAHAADMKGRRLLCLSCTCALALIMSSYAPAHTRVGSHYHTCKVNIAN